MELQSELPGFKSIRCGLLQDDPKVGVVQLARPAKLNAFDKGMWEEFPRAVRILEALPSVRTVLVCAQGKLFCAGIDVGYLKDTFLDRPEGECPGEAREHIRRGVLQLQAALSSVEHCRWPVIAAVHGACIGGGIDLITACDVRICSGDASFCVKEVDVAIAADLGTLQRLPKLVGHGIAMDLALSARTIDAVEALRLNLVTRVVEGGGDEVQRAGAALAKQLAAKPSLALLGTKRVLLQARDHSVADSLEYVATWNSAMLISHDLDSLIRKSAPRTARGGSGSGGGGPQTAQSKL